MICQRPSIATLSNRRAANRTNPIAHPTLLSACGSAYPSRRTLIPTGTTRNSLVTSQYLIGPGLCKVLDTDLREHLPSERLDDLRDWMETYLFDILSKRYEANFLANGTTTPPVA
jgi:hypothetical protein